MEIIRRLFLLLVSSYHSWDALSIGGPGESGYSLFMRRISCALPAVVWPHYRRSPRTALLLIYRIQSHTHPKRRKFCLKHAGRKSVKEELPERRKGPKRAAECRLKVPTHVWELEAASSSLATRTILGRRLWISHSGAKLWDTLVNNGGVPLFCVHY